MEQLATLSSQLAEVDSLPIVAGQTAQDIAKRALSACQYPQWLRRRVILDTALGRTTASTKAVMKPRRAEIAKIAEPSETLLVAGTP